MNYEMNAAPVWQLRPDLEIIPVESAGGSPSILVHDPLSGNFDRVDWPESDLLRLLRRPRRAEELRQTFSAANTLRPTLDDIVAYLAELGRRGWLRGGMFWPRTFREKRRPGILEILAKALFIQIPFLRPERFLRATAGLVGLLVNPLTLFLVVCCGVMGLYLALPRWEEYWRDSLGSFGLGRVPAFLFALILVKVAHEFSHAYAATLAGARVAGMGVAFFFFMPLPFTDVTDAWRLSWPERLRVASAGMLAEVAVAGVSLLLWALSPPGEVAMALARVSSVAVLSTLLTNLNPGPRFDGYYILVCLFRTENLRARGMAALRRVLWGSVFGIGLPDEEQGMGGGRRSAILLYAAYALFYRFSLGFGLALMAYYMLPKAIGLPLAAAELWLFFGNPVLTEVMRLGRNVKRMRFTPLLALLLLVLAGAGVWVCGSWPRRVDFPAVTRPVAEEAVRAARGGMILEMPASRGMRTEAGDILAVLDAPTERPLLRRAEWALREAEISEEQAWHSETSRREAGRRAAEVRRRRVELDALRQRFDYLTVRSPRAGMLATWDRDLAPGVSVSRGKLLGWLVDGPGTVVSCYPPMEIAGRLEVGAATRFFPDSGEGCIAGRIVRIDSSRPEILEDAQLAGVLGAVQDRGGSFVLSRPYARVMVELDAGAPRLGQTGRVWVWTKPESLLEPAWNWLKGLAVRESAF